MRTIERSSAFKRDHRRVKATLQHRHDLDGLLLAALALLADDQPLPESWRDHALSGTWSSYREYHLKPDLLLIYRTMRWVPKRVTERRWTIPTCSP
jgi:mRNA interferase YafQ